MLKNNSCFFAEELSLETVDLINPKTKRPEKYFTGLFYCLKRWTKKEKYCINNY